MSRRTPEEVLKSIVDGINTGNLMPLYEPGAAFAAQPGSLTRGLAGVPAQVFERPSRHSAGQHES
jgi:hypothetical protein